MFFFQQTRLPSSSSSSLMGSSFLMLLPLRRASSWLTGKRPPAKPWTNFSQRDEGVCTLKVLKYRPLDQILCYYFGTIHIKIGTNYQNFVRYVNFGVKYARSSNIRMESGVYLIKLFLCKFTNTFCKLHHYIKISNICCFVMKRSSLR